jgi:hypothetical protein
VTRVLVARLGGLPKEKAVRAFGEWVLTLERAFRASTLTLLDPGLGREALDDLLWRVLEEVRGMEGLRSFQVSGTQRKGYSFPNASVLVAIGVHASRSVFALHYEQCPVTGQHGELPDRTYWVRKELQLFPMAKRELEVLRRRLCGRYPGLEAALGSLKDPPLLVEAVPRGQVVFLANPAAEVTHALVGKALFPIRHAGWLYPPKTAVGAPEEALAKLLRERTSLGALPPERVLALLRGEGDVEEAERVWGLARLRGL